MKNGGSVSSWEGSEPFVKHYGQQINVSLLKIPSRMQYKKSKKQDKKG
jgi:hypothetical protein